MTIKKHYPALSIYLNRFASLISEYGYTILINVLLSRISIQLVMYFWVVKSLAALVSNHIRIKTPKIGLKYLLISFEILKAGALFLLGFGLPYLLILGLVFLIEIINILFSSYLYSYVPHLIDQDSLMRFNARYTSIGSLSYFLAPLFVGIFIDRQEFLLFSIYAALLLIGSLALLFLPNPSIQEEEQGKDETQGNIRFSFFMQRKMILAILFSGVIVGSIGVLYDTYEVVFLTKDLGITASQYSFSLSFLAIAFLLVSFLLSFVKQIQQHLKIFQLGLLLYVAYLLLFSFSVNLLTVLGSYLLLALGQTLMGLIETNYFQLTLSTAALQKVYVYTEMMNSLVSGIIVLIVGSISLFSDHLMMVFRLLALIACLVPLVYLFFLKKEKYFK